jgi:hypothetical protein
MNRRIAVGEGSNDVLREPCRFPCDFEGDSEDGGVLVFRADAGEVFRCEANMDMLLKVFSGEVVCL